jgi:hypothetical protein
LLSQYFNEGETQMVRFAKSIAVLLFSPVLALGEIEWVGFGDIQTTVDGNDESLTIQIGQLELDLSIGLTDDISTELAYAYDEGIISSGAAFLDFHLAGEEEIRHPARGFYLNHSGLMYGQFDVPFGIDYLVIPSLNRKLITVPLTVEMMHDCWNDIGLQIYSDFNIINMVAYIVNGEALGDNSIGGRIGLMLWEGLEIGGSLASTISADEDVMLFGADFNVELGSLYAKGEYISKTTSSNVDITSTGYYAELGYCMEKFFLAGRYSSYLADEEVENDNQIALGCGYVLTENVELRMEYTKLDVEGEESNAVTAQVAFRF